MFPSRTGPVSDLYHCDMRSFMSVIQLASLHSDNAASAFPFSYYIVQAFFERTQFLDRQRFDIPFRIQFRLTLFTHSP